jgi:hypothetical protein
MVMASFHSGKLSVDWNGQQNFSLSCELWVGTNDFNTNVPTTDNFPEWKLARQDAIQQRDDFLVFES